MSKLSKALNFTTTLFSEIVSASALGAYNRSLAEDIKHNLDRNNGYVDVERLKEDIERYERRIGQN